MNNSYRILAINPGAATSKFAVYENDKPILKKMIKYSHSKTADIEDINDQLDMRTSAVLKLLDENNISLDSLDAIVGRGGLIEPIESGVYSINEHMIEDLKETSSSVHASSLGAIMAYEIAKSCGKPSFVVDPIVVDELDQYAKLSGFPGIERRSVFHALNQKAIARKCARRLGVPYENSRFIVTHMGSGVTVGAHRYGRVIDVNDAISGEGPFTPERTGSVPILPIIELCFSGAYTEQEMCEKITKKGGLVGYIGTNELEKCERLLKEGDDYATLVFESMAYQISKEIGAMVAVLEGRVDAIILTGGMAFSDRFTGSIKQRVSLIAPIHVFPGENELSALVEGALRVLRGDEEAIDY